LSFEARSLVRSGVTLDGNEHRLTGEATKKASVFGQSETKLIGCVLLA